MTRTFARRGPRLEPIVPAGVGLLVRRLLEWARRSGRAPEVKIWLGTAVVLMLAWLSTVVGIVVFLSTPLMLVFSAWLLVRRQWLSLLRVALLSPFFVAALNATKAYTQGTAALIAGGRPDLEQGNVDPETRYQWESRGCVDPELWDQTTHNLTLRFLRYVLGPMPTAYAGPYPSDAEVRTALRANSVLSWERLESDQVEIGTRRFQLRRGLGVELASVVRRASRLEPERMPLVALWRDRVILIQLPLRDPWRTLISVIDAATGKSFAYIGEPGVLGYDLPEQWT